MIILFVERGVANVGVYKHVLLLENIKIIFKSITCFHPEKNELYEANT